VIQKAADDFEELARDADAPLEQVIQDSKFQRFLAGLLVLEHILQLQCQNMQVAEMQQDRHLAVEIETLRLQVESSKASLQDILDTLRSVDPQVERALKSQPLRTIENFDDLVLKFKSESERESLISDAMCGHCCNHLVGHHTSYKNERYHVMCINLWLNKVKKDGPLF